MRERKHKNVHKVDAKGLRGDNKDDPKDLVADGRRRVERFNRTTKTGHPMFQIGLQLIHRGKTELQASDPQTPESWLSDSFVIADHEANLIVMGHSDNLKRMQRRAGPDICLAKARALVVMKHDFKQLCRSLLCTAAYTLAYTVGLHHNLPTPGCQMIEHLPEDMQKNERKHRKNEKFDKSIKSEEFELSLQSKQFENIFFCNAKYPEIIPTVLLKSGFGPVHDKPGVWRANSTTKFPLKKFKTHWFD